MSFNVNKFRKITRNISRIKGLYRFHLGKCPICESNTLFVSLNSWLRDNYVCIKCLSIPRQRAIIHVLKTYYPDFRNAHIHESSPSGPASEYLEKVCQNYSFSHYFPDKASGSFSGQVRCENLEALSFGDNIFDLFVTQDVFEHLYNPFKGFKEIARILKPGGVHFFTVPYYEEMEKSEPRILLKDGVIEYIKPKEYHKNPVDEKGSLVTYDYGRDLALLIDQASGLKTTVFLIREKKLGLDGQFLHVFASIKP